MATTLNACFDNCWFEHWKEGMELQLMGITNLTGWKNYVTKLITKDGFGQGEKVYFPMM
jgi:hypothetical protein